MATELQYEPLSATDNGSKTANDLYYPAAGDPEPPFMSHWAPVTTGGFVGTMFLILIPGVNLILLAIWAVGAKKMQKRYYARAALIVISICAALFGIAALLFGAFWLGWFSANPPTT